MSFACCERSMLRPRQAAPNVTFSLTLPALAKRMRVQTLNVPDQIAHTTSEGLCNSTEGNQRYVFLSTLDPAQVVRMQLGLLCQPLLRQTGASPFGTDGGADSNAIVEGRRHSLTRKQTSPLRSTPLNG